MGRGPTDTRLGGARQFPSLLRGLFHGGSPSYPKETHPSALPFTDLVIPRRGDRLGSRRPRGPGEGQLRSLRGGPAFADCGPRAAAPSP